MPAVNYSEVLCIPKCFGISDFCVHGYSCVVIMEFNRIIALHSMYGDGLKMTNVQSYRGGGGAYHIL